MTSPPSLFHAFLRPSILQILRATGYHSTRPAVLDSLTDLAARYLTLLCEGTAGYATHNHGDCADFTVVDVRMALQDAGALLPERDAAEQEWRGDEDLRGMEEFIKWFAGQRMKEMMDFANGDGESDATDYLNALKTKHSKTGDDAKYQGTILGKSMDAVTGDIQVEGGPEASINEWIINRLELPAAHKRQINGDKAADAEDGDGDGDANDNESRASSALSSVGDRLDNDTIMDMA